MTTAVAPPSLLTADERAGLARLQLVHRRPHRGDNPGERRSLGVARSPEPADFRPYAPGDDLRRLDWQALARFDRLILRLDVAEEESALNIVLDASASMAFGTPPKWMAARRLAGALGLVGLAGMDRVAVGLLGGGGLHTPHVRRSGGAGRLLGFLGSAVAQGTAGPADLASLRWLRAGMTIVISDFLVDGSWSPALAVLRRARQEPVLWQVLAPEEERPDLDGDVLLQEVESSAELELTVTPGLVRSYLGALAEHRLGLRRQAAAGGGRFLDTLSVDDLPATVAAGLRAGVLRRA